MPLPPLVEQLLRDSRHIAIVGYSANPDRPSHWIARYLKEDAGYHVSLVNPVLESGLGQAVLPDLRSIATPIDLVDVFRAPPHVPAILDEALAVEAKAFWMQPGAENEEAAQQAEAAGLACVIGRCLYADHKAWRS